LTSSPSSVSRRQALQRHGDLEHRPTRVEPELNLPDRFRPDLIGGFSERLDLQDGDELRELEQVGIHVLDPVSMHERRGRGQTIEDAQPEALLDLLAVRAVQVQLHVDPRCCCVDVC